jgi:hypothetical protein
VLTIMSAPSDTDLEALPSLSEGVTWTQAVEESKQLDEYLASVTVASPKTPKRPSGVSLGGFGTTPGHGEPLPLSVAVTSPPPVPRGGRGRGGRGRGEFIRGRGGRRGSDKQVLPPKPEGVGIEDIEGLTVQSVALSDALADQKEEILALQSEISVLKASQTSLLSLMTSLQRRVDELAGDTPSTPFTASISQTRTVAPKAVSAPLHESSSQTQSLAKPTGAWLDNLDF